jgi:hypothetical protein
LKLGSTFTKDEINEYVQLLKEFYDIFAWMYDDLKEYDEGVIQHVIRLKEETKPVRHKPRIINHKLKPLSRWILVATHLFQLAHPDNFYFSTFFCTYL